MNNNEFHETKAHLIIQLLADNIRDYKSHVETAQWQLVHSSWGLTLCSSKGKQPRDRISMGIQSSKKKVTLLTEIKKMSLTSTGFIHYHINYMYH